MVKSPSGNHERKKLFTFLTGNIPHEDFLVEIPFQLPDVSMRRLDFVTLGHNRNPVLTLLPDIERVLV